MPCSRLKQDKVPTVAYADSFEGVPNGASLGYFLATAFDQIWSKAVANDLDHYAARWLFVPSRHAHLLCLVLLDISLVPFQQCPCMLIVIVNLLMLSLACKLVYACSACVV